MWMQILHKHPENAFDNSNLDSGCHGERALGRQLQTIVTPLHLPSESGHFRLAHHIVSFFGT